MDAVTAALFGSLGGAAVGGAIGFIGTFITIRSQSDRDDRQEAFRRQLEADADARRIRDARRERLRRAYKALVLGAISANEMVRNTRYILNIDETAERRDLRLGQMLAKAWRDLDTARIALMLETDGREVLDIFDQDVYRPFQRFRTASAIDKEAKGSISQDEFVRLIGLVAEGVERMVVAARSRLEVLEQATSPAIPAGAVL